ncbi:hypothetical protein AALB53_08995 [Lachnospiraceae bacterium 47-T17]
MVQEFKVDGNIVRDIKKKYYAAEAARNVIASIVESHAMDKNTAVIQSLVFQEYQNQYQQKFREFEEAKNDMFVQTADAATQEKAEKWNLDYATGILSVMLK